MEKQRSINLTDYVYHAQKGKSLSITYLIEKFDPLILKYSKLLNDDDGKQDMVLSFLEILYSIPLDKFPSFNRDYAILNYIKIPIKNKYIYLSKRKCKIYKAEVFNEMHEEASNRYFENENRIEILNTLSVLTKKQREIILLEYYYCYSEAEIAGILHTSRQSVNRLENRALFMLKKTLY